MEVGRIIGGKYRLRREIGKGGMGAVWSAVHETLDRTVAIKFLKPSHEDAETASARFVAEAKSAARVKHRFVVDVFDFGITEDGVYYMVQELLEGEELAACMDHGPAWEVRDAVQLIAQCLSGLEAVHQAGIVHRDLKPENIFVMRDSDGRFPKLLDFGISKLTDPPRGNLGAQQPTPVGRGKQLTAKGIALGTPWYMSPEQLRGRQNLDGRSDLYGMGVILYEWLSGRVPYQLDNAAELVLQISQGKAPPLVSLRPELGHEISAVIARALAPEPEARFQSAAEMREALTAGIPSLPRTWTMVQRSLRPPPVVESNPPGMGKKTELFLKSAESPFKSEDDTERRSPLAAARRIRPWMWGVAAALVAALIALPFFLNARPERANAKVEGDEAPAPAVRSSASQVERPTTTTAVAPPAPTSDAPEAQPAAGSSEPEARAEGSDEPAKPARRQSSSKRRKSEKKVIRTLDF